MEKILPNRKSNRFKNYDYSTEGAYFVTICTKDRAQILCDIVGEGLCALPSINLTPIGEIVRESIDYINNYDNITIDKYVIMPNHIHMILIKSGGHGDPPLPIYDVIGRFKSYTDSKYKSRGHGDPPLLWQRSFYDHVIRDEKDYLKIWDYIDTNPARWQEDKYYNT